MLARHIDVLLGIYVAVGLFGVSFAVLHVGRELIVGWLGMVAAVGWLGITLWLFSELDQSRDACRPPSGRPIHTGV